MSEKNWALGVNGAQVHDVSNEASHVASTAANLLNDAEDQLWVSGDAPQHVTIRLSPSHPPLHYSGWYVWHDYMTNPKRVEVSSGEHPDRMAAILVSEALPGAGTQIWRLPVPIPSHHLYVRFKILETFGKGPTYMNHVVLFASDPGPRYRHISSSAAPIGASSSTNQDVTATATVSASSGGSYGIRTAQQDKVGVFLHTSSGGGGGGGGGATTSTTTTTATTAGVGRVSQLLKDLDEDIRSLRPIKSLSPSKNMLLYLPQDPSPQLLLQEEGGLGEDTMDEEFLASDFRDEHQHQHQQHHQQHQPPVSCCGVDHTAQQHHHHNALAQPAASSTPSVPAHVMDSIRTLEKTVAALTQTVNHQKEDIAMMKRLLLQRAAEQRREESRRSAADAAVTTQLGAAPATSTPSPAIHHGGGGGGVSSLSANGYKLRHNNIDIEFPEDALRGFVESVMADKLRRQMKKSETRLIGRVDTYMREVIQCITDAVDERVQNHLLMQQQQQQQMLQLPEQLPAAARIPPRAALHSAAVAGGSSSYNTPSRQPDGSQAAAAGSAVPSPILPSSGADYYRKPATHPYSPSVQSFFNNLQPPTGSAAPISIIKDTSLSDQGGRR